METIRELRNRIGLTQKEAAEATGVSLRSFADHERDESKMDRPKYKYIVRELKEKYLLDEQHGVLSVDEIKKLVEPIFAKYDVEYAILFGSYAKGYANESSDVDFLISSKVTGLKYFGMVEELRQALNKKVDALDVSQLNDNIGLTQEILKDGIKVYG